MNKYVICIALVLAGCGGSSSPPVTLSSIAISPDPVYIGMSTLLKSSTLSLTAIGNYSNGTTSDITSRVTWTSAASAVASVGTAGLVTAAVGATSGATTFITASLSGLTHSVNLTVTASGSTSLGVLNLARYDHTATLLNDGTGRVLVAGGYGATNTALPSAELYDPILNAWTQTGDMGTARRDHTATLLSTGKVVQIGGGGNAANNDLDSADIYTPDSGIGSWSQSYPHVLQTPRSYHTATLLNSTYNSGKELILVVGGGGVNNSADLYDPNNYPAASAVAAAPDTSATGRYSHTATLLAPSDGRVLVAGGFANSATGAGTVLDTAELYSPTGSAVVATGTLATGRYLHSATLLGNGQVLVAGGIDATGHEVNTAELFNPATGTWSQTGSLATARFGHIATLMPGPAGLVLVMGGSNASNPNLSSAELYNPTTGTWIPTANLQTGRAVFSATLLTTGPNAGSVLLAGGDGATGTLKSVELHW